MELLIIINTIIFIYYFISFYQIYKYRQTMENDAYHHLLSHLFLVGFFGIGINLFLLKDMNFPLLFALMYMMQHVTKENMRLIKTNRWTSTVDGGD